MRKDQYAESKYRIIRVKEIYCGGLISLLAFFSLGCSNSEMLWDVGTTAGGVATGALIGSALSDDPWVIAGSSVVGGVAGHGVNTLRKSGNESQFMEGYEQGLSDSVKRQYWIQSSMQKIIEEPK